MPEAENGGIRLAAPLPYSACAVCTERGEKYYSFPYSLHFMMFRSVSQAMTESVDL